MKAIEGKIAKILNAREVVINRGSLQGVEVGMIFKILDLEEINILDPDTKQNLGSVERTKVKVKVDLVKKNMCVAKTYRKETVNIGGHASGLLAFAEQADAVRSVLMPPQWVDRYETLRLPKNFEKLEESDSIVNIGDIVISTSGEEDAASPNSNI